MFLFFTNNNQFRVQTCFGSSDEVASMSSFVTQNILDVSEIGATICT